MRQGPTRRGQVSALLKELLPRPSVNPPWPQGADTSKSTQPQSERTYRGQSIGSSCKESLVRKDATLVVSQRYLGLSGRWHGPVKDCSICRKKKNKELLLAVPSAPHIQVQTQSQNRPPLNIPMVNSRLILNNKM